MSKPAYLSWRAVANELAHRMQHHVYCDAHPEAEADPENCPFCADRAAFRLWQRKAGVVPKAEPVGETLPVSSHRSSVDKHGEVWVYETWTTPGDAVRRVAEPQVGFYLADAEERYGPFEPPLEAGDTGE
jgi:hypothetical protein